MDPRLEVPSLQIVRGVTREISIEASVEENDRVAGGVVEGVVRSDVVGAVAVIAGVADALDLALNPVLQDQEGSCCRENGENGVEVSERSRR